jgi:hypothetical protein
VLQLNNETPFSTERAILLDGSGVQHWVVVIKATYAISSKAVLELAEEQEPVCVAPKYFGEPGKSSLARESELTFSHPGTDVIVNGSAHAPRGRAVDRMDVQVAVGSLRKHLRVVGERRWFRSLGALIMSEPVPFTQMPIRYERAYGGTTAGDLPASEPRNPIGRGFVTARAQLVDQLLPNVEDISFPLRDGLDRPPPAGLGAVASTWAPRVQHAGTYDEAWVRDKLPLWPDDFSTLHFSAAPPGLHALEPLQGGEPVNLSGLSRDGPLALRLPREVLMVDTWIRRERVRQPVQLFRVILDPDEGRVVMVWRSSLKCGLRFREIGKTRVAHKLRVPK